MQPHPTADSEALRGARSALEADVRRFLREHAGQYLDILELLTALRERHSGTDHHSFVEAVDDIIAELYQKKLFGIPGLKWAPPNTAVPESTRGWFSRNADSIVWNPELQVYTWGISRTRNHGLYILPKIKRKPWHAGIDGVTLYGLMLLLIMFVLALWSWLIH